MTVTFRGGKELVSWSATPGLGLVTPSAWPEQVQKISMSYVLYFLLVYVIADIDPQTIAMHFGIPAAWDLLQPVAG